MSILDDMKAAAAKENNRLLGGGGFRGPRKKPENREERRARIVALLQGEALTVRGVAERMECLIDLAQKDLLILWEEDRVTRERTAAGFIYRAAEQEGGA